MVKFYIENTKLVEYIAKSESEAYLESLEDSYSEQVVIPLRVIRSSSFDTTPDYKIAVTDLNKGSDGFLYKRFHNKGFGGIRFKISIALEKDEIWKSGWYQKYMGLDTYEHNVLTVLKTIMRAMTPVKVVTDAIDIPNGIYIITKNPSRKQTNDNYTVWELEFTTYVPLDVTAYENDNTLVKNAIKSAQAKKNVAAKTTTAKGKTTKITKLSQCQLSVLVYSKKKKTVTCVKYMQQILKDKKFYNGKIDGWYGSLTVAAVKKFQKKYKLKQTGKVDKKTFNKLISFEPKIKNTVKKVNGKLSNALKKA